MEYSKLLPKMSHSLANSGGVSVERHVSFIMHDKVTIAHVFLIIVYGPIISGPVKLISRERTTGPS